MYEPIDWRTKQPKKPENYNDLDKLLVAENETHELLRQLISRMEILEQEIAELKEQRK
jgi:hypothetical protein